MAKKYFTTITTHGTDVEEIHALHGEKLNNYLHFGVAKTNKVLDGMSKGMYAPEKENIVREIHHMNTVPQLRNFEYYLTTYLCCEDEPITENSAEGEY